jgi:hypothetical protein
MQRFNIASLIDYPTDNEDKLWSKICSVCSADFKLRARRSTPKF